MLPGERRWLAGARCIIECAVKTARAVALPYGRHMYRGAIQMTGDIGILHAVVGFEKNICPSNDAGGMGAGVEQRIDNLPVFSGQVNVVEFHAPQ